MRQSAENETVLFVTDHHGRQHTLSALVGWRVMEVIRDWGVEVAAECGGAGLCAKCHVYVDESWIDRLDPPSVDELNCLDEATGVEAASRLSCQILVSQNISGLQLRLAPGSERS
jgi:2Fe-2S ferredoxin